MLLWQESLAKPSLDVKKFAAQLEEAIGQDSFSRLRAIPERELESLRFGAERLHGKSESLERDAALLLRRLTRERLDRELAENAEALRRAEASGSEEVGALLERGKLLTGQIAKIVKEE